MKTDPAWERKLYEMQFIARSDIPRKPGVTATKVPFAEWRKQRQRSDFKPTLWMVAVTDNGDYVGTGNFWVRDPEHELADNGFLGILRPYRRRGIARALKVTLIKQAQRERIQSVYTSNEQNNPMLQLNLQLGFVPQPGWHQMDKRFDHSGFDVSNLYQMIFGDSMADYALRKMALIDADFQTLSDIERMMAPEEYGSGRIVARLLC